MSEVDTLMAASVNCLKWREYLFVENCLRFSFFKFCSQLLLCRRFLFLFSFLVGVACDSMTPFHVLSHWVVVVSSAGSVGSEESVLQLSGDPW